MNTTHDFKKIYLSTSENILLTALYVKPKYFNNVFYVQCDKQLIGQRHTTYIQMYYTLW